MRPLTLSVFSSVVSVASVSTFFALVILLSCNSKPSNQSNIVPKQEQTTSDATNENQSDGNDDFDYSDCTRGQAEPVTRKSIYPQAIFKLNPDNHTGVETVDLESGDKLIITNHGCEYYVLTFRIETTRFQKDTIDTIYWLHAAVVLMKEIQEGIDAPINIKDAVQAMSVHTASMDSRRYKLGEEIVFNDDIIRSVAYLDRIQKINENRFAIEVSFSIGPL